MDILLLRGAENSGKTTTAAMTFFELEKKADKIFLFDFYDNRISEVLYNKNGDVYDFKAIVVIKGKVIIVITAGDQVWRLLLNIRFLLDFVKNELKLEVEILVVCGKSINRKGSAFLKLKELYPNSKLTEIWVSRVDEKLMQSEKQKAVDNILRLSNP